MSMTGAIAMTANAATAMRVNAGTAIAAPTSTATWNVHAVSIRMCAPWKTTMLVWLGPPNQSNPLQAVSLSGWTRASTAMAQAGYTDANTTRTARTALPDGWNAGAAAETAMLIALYVAALALRSVAHAAELAQ